MATFNHAVIFYNEQRWISGLPQCFGTRGEAQMLPKGSIVVGFLKWNPTTGLVEELLDKPFTKSSQDCSWEETLRHARESVNGEEDYCTCDMVL